MLRIVPSQSAAAAQRYFDDALARGDYYLEGQELAGNWGGAAAERLGLSGAVTREAFHQLCNNRNPATGERLTARTRSNRRVGYDFNFHCPKALSAVFALTEDARILDAFRASVQETMQELERDAECRVRDRGQNGSRTSGSMVWGEFIHFTTRPVDGAPDPHLHAHLFAFNATWDAEQECWKAADFGNIKRDARYFEAAFHARLAGRMAAMGYPVRRDGRGFWDIAGIPESVREKFSRRTAEINALAQELGIVDPRKLDALGATSRQAKAKGATMEELRRTWDGWLTPGEREAIRRAGSDADGTPRAPLITAGASLTHAIDHVFERRSVVDRRHLAEQALRRGVGSVGVADVWRQVEAMKQTGALLSGERDGRPLVTTRQVLAEEKEMIAFARTGRGSCGALGRADYRFTDPLLKDGAGDNAEQQAAVLKVLGSHDRVIAVRGGAGTGKTTLMREIARGIEENGHRIHAFAPTAEASRGVLRQEGFAGADTVAQLLANREMQQRVRGQVLWIDEAGLLGAGTLNRVFRLARAQGCRVILTGDTGQNMPVDRGDAMRILEAHGGIAPVRVAKIQRQRVHRGPEPEEIRQYREAVKALAAGDPLRGFDRLERMGAVTAFDIDIGPEERCQRIAADYLEASAGRNRKGAPNSVLAVSPTHAEGDAVTRHIRDGLRRSGRLGEQDRTLNRLVNLNWTEAERRDPAKYRPGQVVQLHQHIRGGFTRGQRFTVVEADGEEVRVRGGDGEIRSLPLDAAGRFSVFEERALLLAAGDRIRITQNGATRDGKHRLNNGTVYEIEGFTRGGGIRLANGWEIEGSFGHLTHGYVSTSHGSQGKTSDVVLIAQSAQSLPASSLEQFYVSVSRGREQVRIYTDDREELRAAIQRSAQRVSATELAGKRTGPALEKERRRNRQYRQVVGRRRDWLKKRNDHERSMDRG